MNILVTLDENYIPPLKVMLWSLFFNNPGCDFKVYLLHSSIPENSLRSLRRFVENNGQKLFPIQIDNNYFENAPVVMHYTKEMYYRLLAYKFLPQDMNKILYLDPDILIINSIRELYNMDISDNLFAAAFHKRVPIKEINKLRLKAYEMEEYFNSGVLLMNLELQRKEIDEGEIFKYVEKNKARLVLPDQDILNALFAKRIKALDEFKYNFDTRYYKYARLLNSKAINMEYIIKNTVILHFCGKKKPWKKNYSGKFHSLYQHYIALSQRQRLKH